METIQLNQAHYAHEIAADARTHTEEVARGDRFEFGKNWASFLRVLDENRIVEAEQSLKRMLECDSLAGRGFLDIGSGSGLFSLAARRLGARVHSFDYDPRSVACTMELRRRHFRDDPDWTVEAGSALDADYVKSLGLFDIVYSWGVLHHTGDLWRALEHAQWPVAPGGKLFVAIYNDTGTQSARWKWIKKTYGRLPAILRLPFTMAVSAPEEIKAALSAVLTLRPQRYIRSWTQYGSHKGRGMSHWHDLVDWAGGHPYEYARADQIFDFYKDRGFTLDKMKNGRGLGCNELVLSRTR